MRVSLTRSERRLVLAGNEIKNGGAWTAFKQHLSQYMEKSSEGTLFRFRVVTPCNIDARDSSPRPRPRRLTLTST